MRDPALRSLLLSISNIIYREEPMPDYIAAFCTMEDGALVPFESINITAKDDVDAERQAVEWRVSSINTIDRRTWLQVVHDGTAVFSMEITRI
jgi:hypothetical protein